MHIATHKFILALHDPEKLRNSSNGNVNKVYPSRAKDCVPFVNSARPDFGEGTTDKVCNVTKAAPQDTDNGPVFRSFKCTPV